jgi:uncharacterized membrane protein
MAEIIVLRIVHILGGIFWLGSGMFTTFFLGPALSTLGPSAGQVMGALQARKMFVTLPIVASLTILAGLRLMWLTSGGFASEYFESTRGMTFSASGGLAILSFLISLLIVRPTATRMTALAQSGGSGEEISRLRKRVAVFSVVATTLLIVAAVGMAIARYLA